MPEQNYGGIALIYAILKIYAPFFFSKKKLFQITVLCMFLNENTNRNI